MLVQPVPATLIASIVTGAEKVSSAALFVPWWFLVTVPGEAWRVGGAAEIFQQRVVAQILTAQCVVAKKSCWRKARSGPPRSGPQ